MHNMHTDTDVNYTVALFIYIPKGIQASGTTVRPPNTIYTHCDGQATLREYTHKGYLLLNQHDITWTTEGTAFGAVTRTKQRSY